MALLSRLLLVGVFLLPVGALAKSQVRNAGNFGIGLGSGYASGLSGKYLLRESTAIQATLGTFGLFESRADVSGFALGADFLVEMPEFFRLSAVELAWNIGGGLGLSVFDSDFGDDLAISVQGVLGFEVNLVPIPLDIVIEYRPELQLVEDVEFDVFDLGAHVRYYF